MLNNDFSFLVDKKSVFKTQQKLERILKNNSKDYGKITVGIKSGSWKQQVYFLRNYEFWWTKWERKNKKRIVNAFGLGEPNWNGGNNINFELSIPYSKPNFSLGGTLVENTKGEIFLAHSGRMGGSRKGISMDSFRKLFPRKAMWKTITNGEKTKDYVLISAINDKKFLSKLEYFIREYHKIKEKLIQDASSKSSKKSSIYDKIEKMKSKVNSEKQSNRSRKRSNQKKWEEFDHEEAIAKVLKKIPRSEIDKMIRKCQETNSQNIKLVTSKRYFRNPILSALMKEKYKHTCQLCNRKTFPGKMGNLYTESHHVIPRSKKGPDSPNNILILCPTCHKIFDKGTSDVLIDTYRKMRRNHLFSDFDGLLKAKEITKLMYKKILK